MSSTGENSIHAKIVGNPWKVIAATLVLVVATGYFLQFVSPSVSYKDLLGQSYPLLKDYDRIQSEYTNDDNLLVLIEAKSGDAFTAEILSGVKDLTAELWGTPHSIRVDSVTNYQHTQADGDDLEVADLVRSTENLTLDDLARIKEIALNEPLLVNRVVTPDGSVLAINVSFAFPNEGAEEKLAADGFVQSLAEEFRQEFRQTNVYVGGLVALDATVLSISTRETGLFLGLVILIVVTLLALLLRTLQPVLASILVFMFAIVAAMALSGLMGWKLTPFTASVPMIVLIIAVADCVHVLTTFVHRLNGGEGKAEALMGSLAHNFKPVVITSLTTAVGFLTMNFSESSGIRALGNQSAFGVVVAGALSLTFLPAVVSLLPVRSRNRQLPSVALPYDAITEFLFRNRTPILASSVLLAVVLGASATRNEFNDRIPTYFAESLPWRVANDFGEKQFGGAYTFSYSVETEADGVSDPGYLSQVEGFASWLRSLPEVAYVNSITDTFKRLNKNMHGDDNAHYRLPDEKTLASQYLLLYELSLPYGLDLNDQVNLDKSGTKVLAAFRTMSTSEVLAMEERVNTWVATNLPNLEVRGSGVQMMFAHLLDQDTKGLTLGAIYGLLVISLLLIFTFRSLKIGIVSVLPNILPVFLAFGVWGLLVGQVGMGLAMVSGMSIGIIVDDTVHFLANYLKARREEGLDAKQAVAYTLRHVGPAIVFTTVVLVAGFITMALVSEFRVNSDMGKMTSMILGFALVFDLVTLPILLMIFDRKPYPATSLREATPA